MSLKVIIPLHSICLLVVASSTPDHNSPQLCQLNGAEKTTQRKSMTSISLALACIGALFKILLTLIRPHLNQLKCTVVWCAKAQQKCRRLCIFLVSSLVFFTRVSSRKYEYIEDIRKNPQKWSWEQICLNCRLIKKSKTEYAGWIV